MVRQGEATFDDTPHLQRNPCLPHARPTSTRPDRYPPHIVQCGNNRQSCFLNDGVCHCYLTLLGEALLDTRCHLHAYVLMDDHIHLLVTPAERGYVSHMIRKLGWHYSSQFNARNKRTDTLWEGRFKSFLVDIEEYVLRCHRYIDLNPVRARMIDDPAAFQWSSCSAHSGAPESLLTSHPAPSHSAPLASNASTPIEPCSTKCCPTIPSRKCVTTCNSNAPSAATISST